MHAESLLAPRRRRIQHFRDIETRVRGLSTRSERDELLLYLAIEMLNLWTQFCRSYILHCGTGLHSNGGVTWRSPLARGRSREDLRQILVAKHGRGKKSTSNPMDEPTWRRPQTVSDCCSTLAIGNARALRAAQGLTASFLDELHVTRNFAAHKCANTATALDQVTLRRGYSPEGNLESLMLAPGSSGYGTVTLEWAAEIENRMETMCA